MKILKLVIMAGILAAAVGLPMLIQRHAQDALRTRQQLLRQQALDAERLAVENGLLSNIVAKARTPQAFSEAQLAELLKLRNEVGQLQSSLGETNQLAHDIRRVRRGLQELAAEQETRDDSPTALLADQRELRLARLTRVREWLAQRPEESIPELRFLSEESWVRSADRTQVTDEEYRRWMVGKRAEAEMEFSHMAYKALQKHARANSGAFPADLAELKPYFSTPIEDSILERYTIVPSKSLIPSLAQAGKDWVVTQKAPINTNDMRMAISATDCRGTFEKGRWETVP
jgi:type II secretory pathway pseudopilin PulG